MGVLWLLEYNEGRTHNASSWTIVYRSSWEMTRQHELSMRAVNNCLTFFIQFAKCLLRKIELCSTGFDIVQQHSPNAFFHRIPVALNFGKVDLFEFSLMHPFTIN